MSTPSGSAESLTAAAACAVLVVAAAPPGHAAPAKTASVAPAPAHSARFRPRQGSLRVVNVGPPAYGFPEVGILNLANRPRASNANITGESLRRASYQVAVTTAQDLVTTARNITDPDGDLTGDIGCAVLARRHGPRRPRACACRVKSPLSRWSKHPPGKPATRKKITQFTSEIRPGRQEPATR
jgi:hypothetical protein